jgi:hypothetical protein
VINCNFLEYDEAGFSGGAIYIEFIAVTNISNTTAQFVKGDDGAVHCFYISKCVLIHNCHFDQCCSYWSGALNLERPLTPVFDACINYTSRGSIFGCHFYVCQTNHSYGGAIYFADVPPGSSVRNCVFDKCSAYGSGGAMFLTDMINVQRSVFLFYCYFNKNYAHTGSGSDVYISFQWSNGGFVIPKPFLECYSTTPSMSKRCYQKEENHSNWLTDVGTKMFQYYSQTFAGAQDTYSCGIGTLYPCKTVQWLMNHQLPDANVIPTPRLNAQSLPQSKDSSTEVFSSTVK